MPILQGELDFHGFVQNLERMPHQREFISTPYSQAAYVGGVGSGKSVVLCGSAILNAVADPYGFSLIGRLNMPALESSTMRTFLEMVPEEYGDWHETKKLFRFHNGHDVVFKHLDISDPKVAGHIKSMNLSAVYVDEGTETAEEVYFLLLSRLRRKLHKTSRLAFRPFRLGSNPAGHDWVWRRFFDPERSDELKRINLGITASTMDNAFLPEEYIQNMLSTYPEDWAQRFIYGSFADFSDLVFKEFSDRTHSWDARVEHAFFNGNNPPESWPIIVGIDIGSDSDHDPWAISCIAVEPANGRLFQYAEVYGNSLLISQIAAQLKPHIDGRKILGIAYDYSNRQCAMELAEYGIHGQPAIKEVEPGLFKCAQYFHIDPRLEHPFNKKLQGSPRYFISNFCPRHMADLGAYKWAKDRSGRPTGEPAHDHSHGPDGIRYAIHTFRPLPAKVVMPKIWENPQLDAASRMYWQDCEKFRDRMEKFKPHGGKEMTIQEWQKAALGAPRKFVRPFSARFTRF